MAGAGLAAKALSLLGTLFVMPIVLKNVGMERAGVWMAITSLMLVGSFSDFGIGNGVMNAVSEGKGRNNDLDIRAAVSNGFFALVVISTALLLLSLGAWLIFDTSQIFLSRGSAYSNEFNLAFAIFLICFLGTIPFNVVQKVQLGLQEGHYFNAWQIAGSIMQFMALYFFSINRLPVAWLVLGSCAPALVVSILCHFYYFHRQRPEFSPVIRLLSRKNTYEIMSIGGLFLFLQLCGALAYTSDVIVVARTAGVVRVPEYVIAAKLFSIIPMFLGTILLPLWPMYGEAVARGDFPWAKRTLKRTMALALLVSVCAGGLIVLTGKFIIINWLGKTFPVSSNLLLAMAVWGVFDSLGNAYSMFLNGANVIRMQVIFAGIFAVTCLISRIFLTTHLGPIGIPLATTICYIVFVVIPYSIMFRWVFRKLELRFQSESS